MLRFLFPALLVGTLLLVLPTEAASQSRPEWDPPAREMPTMPLMAELAGDWRSTLQLWFRGVDRVSGVALAEITAAGEPGPARDRAHLVRFSGELIPVALWTDRNGDGRLDMLELFRDGAVAIQLVDANYDGAADVLRVLDPSGALLSQRRM